MITVAIAFALLRSAPAADVPTGGQVITNLFARYSNLNSLTGTIKLTVSAKAPTGSATEVINTVLQYEKPNKLYLRQERSAPHAKVWLVTSDGTKFSYTYPEGYARHAVTDRLVEPCGQLDVAHIYAATSLSIGDRSAALGIAISWMDELRRISAEWTTYDLAGEVTYNGAQAWKVTGTYRENPLGGVTGNYYLVVSKQGDFLEYGTQQQIATPTGPTTSDSSHPTLLTQTWAAQLTPNGKPDPDLFTLALKN